MSLAEFMRPLDLQARTALAAQARTTWLHLRNVAFSGKVCGIQLAVDIERATGGAVRRWQLRPEDWHRIWPELVGAEGAPPVPADQRQEVRDAA